ncbi:unnamed protein product [Phaedon cochleariae]|uniref:Peptidase metallopeptidase domain-containing protein n=1 Tax=Phaedon cochleariae TaxID=80249 RepID=A0A9N9SCM9_PHACE|nr:unnamed protein product [Phaedon cochleariae]
MHRDTAKMAFDRWEELSNLKFENVRNPSRQKPDITLTVIRKNHNFRANCQGTSKCPHNFDGPGKVLAHAFFPNENNKCIEIHLDAEEKWYLGNSTSPDGQTSLLMVLIHEIGHALGLGHSDVNTAIMYPWYQASPALFDIDDKRAIEYLYGQKTENYQPTTTSTTQTTESQKPISQHTSTTASSVSSNEPHNVDVTSTTSKPQITPTRLCDIQVPDFMFLATAPQFQNYRMYVGYNRFLWKFDLNDMRIPSQPELLDDYLPEDSKSSRVSHVFQNSVGAGVNVDIILEELSQAKDCLINKERKNDVPMSLNGLENPPPVPSSPEMGFYDIDEYGFLNIPIDDFGDPVHVQSPGTDNQLPQRILAEIYALVPESTHSSEIINMPTYDVEEDGTGAGKINNINVQSKVDMSSSSKNIRKTKRESGAFYRKEKKRRIEEISKQAGALKKYFGNPDEPEQKGLNQIAESSSSSSGTNNKSIDFTPDEGDEAARSSSSSPILSECEDESKQEESSAQLALDDPDSWPNILTQKYIDLLVEHGSKQVTDFKFPVDESGRRFSSSYYNKTLVNGEKINRAWLCYSIKLNCIFCFACRLFSRDNSTQIVSTGFSDWRHCSHYLNKHENTLKHIHSIRSWCEIKTRMEKKFTIDAEQQNVYNREKKRWRAIIERMIVVVQFLASQNLAFKGSSTELYHRDNGNFLKAVEVLAKFDPVISEHLNNICKYKDEKQRTPHYLGQHFQNEIINILAESVRNEITRIVKKAKYYTIILDSTPDICHTEQITFVIRCVNTTDGKVDILEFFLGFFPVTNTTGEGLCNFLLKKLLPSLQLEVKDIRGQGYDNGSNMKGKNIGLQKRILDINPRALYVPCAAHTLNLVVNDAASSSGEIYGFFDVVQEVQEEGSIVKDIDGIQLFNEITSFKDIFPDKVEDRTGATSNMENISMMDQLKVDVQKIIPKSTSDDVTASTSGTISISNDGAANSEIEDIGKSTEDGEEKATNIENILTDNQTKLNVLEIASHCTSKNTSLLTNGAKNGPIATASTINNLKILSVVTIPLPNSVLVYPKPIQKKQLKLKCTQDAKCNIL